MRSPRRLLSILFLLAVPGGVATAQTAGDSIAVLPGDARVDSERLVPHRATWRVTHRDADGGDTVQGLWTDTWARSTEDGRAVFLFRQIFVDTEGAVLVDNETLFDAATLHGVRSTQHLPPSGARVTYRYEDNTVSGTLRPSTEAEPREFRIEFDEAVWEPLAPVSVLLPLERLESGTVVRYPIWNQTASGEDVTWNEIRVDSVGSMTVDGGAVDVWHLTATTAAVANTVTRLRQTPDPPYYHWFAVERPGQAREWTLVDWEPFVRSNPPAGP